MLTGKANRARSRLRVRAGDRAFILSGANPLHFAGIIWMDIMFSLFKTSINVRIIMHYLDINNQEATIKYPPVPYMAHINNHGIFFLGLSHI